MAQIRFHNYRRGLSSFDENRRFHGLIHAGVYSGWDRLELLGGNSVRIHHDVTGSRPLNIDNATEAFFMGITVTRQGFFIYEDAPLDFIIAYNNSNGSNRIDLLVVSHQYVASAGGQVATYSIIQGPNGSFSRPSLSSINQVVVGEFWIPANAADLSGISFHKSQVRALGIHAFSKENEADVLRFPDTPLTRNFNFILNSGVFNVSSPTPLSNAPTSALNWNVLVIRRTSLISQIAIDANSGKSYSRSSANGGTTFTPWVNLNNPDVALDFTPITNQIGTRVYTEDNYVNDFQTLTQSIDALDISLKDRADEIGNLNTQVSNVNSSIGSRAYSLQNLLANGESITTSLDKLDRSHDYISSALTGDLNSVSRIGSFIVNPTGVTNCPSAFTWEFEMVIRRAATPGHRIAVATEMGGFYNRRFLRIFNGSVWSGWSLINVNTYNDSGLLIRRKVVTQNWDMVSTASINVNLGVTNNKWLTAPKVSIHNTTNPSKLPLPRLGNVGVFISPTTYTFVTLDVFVTDFPPDASSINLQRTNRANPPVGNVYAEIPWDTGVVTVELLYLP